MVQMTWYIHTWLLTHFDTLRQQGKLKNGRKEVVIKGQKAYYDGELDSEEKCTGFGTAITENGAKIEGMWLKDEAHGLCK